MSRTAEQRIVNSLTAESVFLYVFSSVASVVGVLFYHNAASFKCAELVTS